MKNYQCQPEGKSHLLQDQQLPQYPKQHLTPLQSWNTFQSPNQNQPPSCKSEFQSSLFKSRGSNEKEMGIPYSQHLISLNLQNGTESSQKSSNLTNKTPLSAINKELDENMQQMINLKNRRKELVLMKKYKMISDFEELLFSLGRLHPQEIQQRMQEFQKQSSNESITSLILNSKNSFQMMSIINNYSRFKEGSSFAKESQISHEFWNQNKSIENQIDASLEQLKSLDVELTQSNTEIHESSKNLDMIEVYILELLLEKSEANVKKAEPLFESKKKQQGFLKILLSRRNILKDQKLHVIFEILRLLAQLKSIRLERLKVLNSYIQEEDHLDKSYESPPISLKFDDLVSPIEVYESFMNQLENVTTIQEEMQNQQHQEEQLLIQINSKSSEADKCFAAFVEKSSEEARIFAEFSMNQIQITGYKTALHFFINSLKIQEEYKENIDIQNFIQRLKENLTSLKPWIDENSSISKALTKTQETISGFTNIQSAIQNEQQRRKELLTILEKFQRLNDDEENKHEIVREIELEISRKKHKKTHLEEDLDVIIGEVDLDSYKKLGEMMKSYDQEIHYLMNQQNQTIENTNSLKKEIINLMDQVRSQYDDIINEVLPNNLIKQLDLRNSQDLKVVKNYLQRFLKRLGDLK